MPRLRRFPVSRFIGTRDDMVVYDCDDASQYAVVSGRIDEDGLGTRLLLSSFAPDSYAEARNRGFRPL